MQPKLRLQLAREHPNMTAIRLEVYRMRSFTRAIVTSVCIVTAVGAALIPQEAEASKRARTAWDTVVRIEEVKAQKLGDMILLMGLKDDVNRIAVAQGKISAAAADAQLTAYGKKIYSTPFGANEIAAARGEVSKAATAWVDQIGHDAAASHTWPGGGAGDWQKITQRELARAKGNLGWWLSKGLDPAPILDGVVRVQGWTRGNLETLSPFADHQARVVAAIGSTQTRDTVAKAMGIKLANTPPPPPNLPPVTVFGTTSNNAPTSDGTGGARPVPGEMGSHQPPPSPVTVFGVTSNNAPPPATGGARPIPGEMGMHPGTALASSSATGTMNAHTPPPPPLGSWHSGAVVTTAGRSDVRSVFGTDAVSLEKEGMEFNVDRPGGDTTNFDLDRADPRLCRQMCREDTGCKAFTFVRPGVQGPRARCWLKAAVPAPVKSACCVSGKP